MGMKSYLITLFLFLFSVQILAEEGGAYTIPLEWQKVELQKEIEEKLNHGIQSFAPPGKFLVNIEIGLKASKRMNVGNSSKTSKKSFPLEKLGLNRNSKAFKKAIASGNNNIFSRINRVDVRILIDPKIGRVQETQIKSFVSQTVLSYTGKKAFLKINKSPMLTVGETMQEKIEVAKLNIEGVKLVADAILKSNDKIAQAIAATQGVELKNLDGEKKEILLPKTWQEWVVNFKLPLGIVIATILLLLGISGFKTFEGQKVALMAAANAQQAQAAQASQESGAIQEVIEPEESSSPVDINAMASSGSDGDTGINQFRKMAEQYPETAMYLMKIWLNMNTQESQGALAAITKRIPVEALMPVIGGLEDGLKLKLKKASSQTVGFDDIQKADTFIIDQLVDTFLVDTIALPDELKETIADATVEEFVECIRQDDTYGSGFVNVLQTAQLGRLFSLLSEEEVTKLLEDSLNFNADSVQYMQENLPSSLEQVRLSKQKLRVPIIDKSIDLIRQLGAEREHQVFSLLVASGDHEQIREATKKYFPAQLITKFPKDQIKSLLSRLSTKDRAHLIFSRSNEEQKLFMSAIGETGRLREIIDSELDEIKSNDKIKKQIQKNKSQIWNKFIVSARMTIKKDTAVSDAAEVVLSKWLKDNGVADIEEAGEYAAA